MMVEALAGFEDQPGPQMIQRPNETPPCLRLKMCRAEIARHCRRLVLSNQNSFRRDTQQPFFGLGLFRW